MKQNIIIAKRCIILAFIFILLLHLLLYSSCSPPSSFAIKESYIVENENESEARKELFIVALRQVGVCTPEDAARVWGKGLITRNAAMQLSVMSKELGEEYLLNLEQTAPNFMVGLSSPWVESFEIDNIAKTTDRDKYIILLRVCTASPSGNEDELKAILTVKRGEDRFWRIEKISMDDALYAYTGFYLQ